MATALYRRYRPESFAEMIGQSQVTAPLMTALRTNRVNHAYLFSGPRGCGKTTSARILARCLNCAEGPTDTPCGSCPSCVELSRGGGGSLDVVEIDAASHGGVEDARDLRERAIFAPARDRYKIFIIDEAHMVTSGGFNALLKIVEEPPEHVKFIFATTEPDKVIGTIRSRTHHYPFRLIPPAQLLEYTQQLCDSEGVKTEPGVLSLAVRAGGGSARDTLSLLDQLIAGSEGDTVEYERAVSLLGFTHTELLDEVIEALGGSDGAAAFAAVDRVVQTGQDPRRFVEDLLERIRDLIVVSASGPERAAAVLRGVPEDELQRMFDQAAVFGPVELSRAAEVVNKTLNDMTGATSPRLHLEFMVARALVPSLGDAERGALTRLERIERRIGVSGPVSAAAEGGGTGARAPQRTVAEIRSEPVAGATLAAPPRAAEPSRATQTPGLAPEPRVAEPAGPVEPPRAAPESEPVPESRTAEQSLLINEADSSAESRPDESLRSSVQPLASEELRSGEEARVTGKSPAAAPPSAAAVTGEAQISPVTLEQMKHSWQEILDVLMRVDRRAWMAAYTATVRELNDDVLVLSFPSANDVSSFRGATSGPESVSEQLRSAIQSVLGFRVRFMARVESEQQSSFPPPVNSVPFGERPAASSREGVAAVPGETSEANVSAPQGSTPVAPVTEWNVVAIPGADSAPSLPTTIGRDVPRVSVSPETPEVLVESEARESPAVREKPEVGEDPKTFESEPSSKTPEVSAPTRSEIEDYPRVSDDEVPPEEDWSPPPPPENPVPNSQVSNLPTQSVPEDSAAPGRSLAEPSSSAAAILRARASTPEVEENHAESTRYGESVVREVLGATFLEEQDLPEETG
ncbi:DNA polymerase III subunit gamma and tau [Lysinibacter sp. HNR]|uniref:DNA polymerase III subunit gamma and tau n=1 Tax=Lysinibacter sp. HNR TaxID=3031408 RepID=UPI0024357050|nr:DNA polymerase III subunit gamma and tau [Lysinibacter sp. HNR]WGD37090.1 DNA polymerase III subunit gamma and tau [Lysinibacter sp. HNR]